MNKLLKFVRDAVLIVSGIIGIFAMICVLCGSFTFIMTCWDIKFADAFCYFAIGFFAAMAALFVIYSLVCVYWAIEKAVKSK